MRIAYYFEREEARILVSILEALEWRPVGLDDLLQELTLELGWAAIAFICHGCGIDTREISEYYMVQDAIWLKAFPHGSGMLCIGCLEDRIGRTLTSEDFIDAPINKGMFGHSERMLARLAGPMSSIP